MSTIIKLRCIDQVLTFDSTPLIASGGVEEDRVQVDFCPKWDGLIKTAVFWRNEKEAFHVLLDEDDSCAIPPEVLIDEGRIYLGFFGVSAEEKQRTSQVLAYNVVKGAITLDSAPDSPTVDIYTQLLAKYLEMVDIAAAMDADQAAFEQEMAQVQTAFEQEIKDLLAGGLVPEDSITTAMLKDGVVTSEKLAQGPRELLAALSRFQNGLGNEYVWAKQHRGVVLGNDTTVKVLTTANTNVKYSSELIIADDGTLSLKDPVACDMANITSYVDVLPGKYVTYPNLESGKPIYCDSSTVINSTEIYIWYKTVAAAWVVDEYVNSPDPNAYPVDDGYTYTARGQLGAGNARIETGSYTGTGTYGGSNPNTLTFGFAPKLVFIYHGGTGTPKLAVFGEPFTAAYACSLVLQQYAKYGTISGMSLSGTTLTWHSTASAVEQFNGGATYYYVAIG